ncbi:MAG TPA: DUF3347 domain-containing protein [Chitinophagaceae bacterium]|nr:DUF3347 domain-containing protein [Chitinophagaceae bacterium]
MTTIKRTIAILGTAFFSLAVVSCKETEEQNKEYVEMNPDHGHPVSVSRTIEVNTEKNPATRPLIDAYLQIKNGLVADDKDASSKGGSALAAAFSAFDMSKLSGEAHKQYMEIMESAKEHAGHIAQSDIDHQREHFEALSTDMNDLIALLGTDKVLYHDFCPMANNDKGAYWISETEEIKNPYFGSEMMNCGSVKKQIN